MDNRSDHTSNADNSFAPVPTWERSAKRNKSLFSGRKTTTNRVTAPIAEEPRSFADEGLSPTRTLSTRSTPAAKPRTVTAIDEAPATTTTVEDSRGLAGGSAFAAAPVYATGAKKSTSHHKGGASGMAIAAGVAAIGVIAAGAWYMSQPRASGVETITPSAPAQTAMAPVAPTPIAPVAPIETAQAPIVAPAAAPAPMRMARAERTERAASAMSADAMGADVSATLPAAPVPYAEIPQVATGGTVAPAPVPASTAAALAAAAAPVNPAPVAAAPATTVPAAPAQPVPVSPAPEASVQPGADLTTNPTP